MLPAAIVYTSGTTWRWKGTRPSASESHEPNAAALIETWGFTTADVLLRACRCFTCMGCVPQSTRGVLASASACVLFLNWIPFVALEEFPPQATCTGRCRRITPACRLPKLNREAVAAIGIYIRIGAAARADAPGISPPHAITNATVRSSLRIPATARPLGRHAVAARGSWYKWQTTREPGPKPRWTSSAHLRSRRRLRRVLAVSQTSAQQFTAERPNGGYRPHRVRPATSTSSDARRIW